MVQACGRSGEHVGQYKLAVCYADGKGCQRDEVKWHKHSAEAGNASVKSNLGFCYKNGTGIAVDLRETVKWYTRTAEGGNAIAQSNLAMCYEGTGIAADKIEAVKCLTLAAEAGVSELQIHLDRLRE